jgi:hypothetical protein
VIPIISTFIIDPGLKWTGGITIPSKIHWNYLTPVFGIPLLILSVFGLIVGILKHRRFSVVLILWVLFEFLIANSGYFRIPFPNGLINQNSVEITLFIPISILAAYSIFHLYSWITNIIPKKLIKFWSPIAYFLGIFIALLGASKLLPTLNSDTVLFRSLDQQAIEWIKTNIPLEETIVINPVGWGYGLYMGQDGGYWISPLTGHQTIPPNVLYGLDTEKRNLVNQFIENLIQSATEPRLIWALCHDQNLKFIFIGTRGGILSPLSLSKSPLFTTLYNQENTWVFEVKDSY